MVHFSIFSPHKLNLLKSQTCLGNTPNILDLFLTFNILAHSVQFFSRELLDSSDPNLISASCLLNLYHFRTHKGGDTSGIMLRLSGMTGGCTIPISSGVVSASSVCLSCIVLSTALLLLKIFLHSHSTAMLNLFLSFIAILMLTALLNLLNACPPPPVVLLHSTFY